MLLPFLYLNRLDGQLAPDWTLQTLIQREQWTVVMAPRPLPGERHWVGGIEGFPTGSYAAGSWSTYAEQWRALDARQVVLTNNCTILRKLEEVHCKPIDVLLAECDELYGVEQLAADLDTPLPWLDPPPIDSGDLLNFLYACHPDPINLAVYSTYKQPRTTYDFTPYAVTVRQRVATAVQTLVRQGYAVTDGETVSLTDPAIAGLATPPSTLQAG